ncbi:MAG: hypothetical protein D6812_02835 [Deltaproteobacteria bacterium]|nr:MAG: hypothetical protein D6812_02835 [Deltaproteobacteria bacterium]
MVVTGEEPRKADSEIVITFSTLLQMLGALVIIVTAVWSVSRINTSVQVLDSRLLHLSQEIDRVQTILQDHEGRIRELELPPRSPR